MWPDAQPLTRRERSLLISAVGISMVLVAVAIAYYFAISLPAYHRDHLALEQQKYADELKRQSADASRAAQKEQERVTALNTCFEETEMRRTTYLRLNGTVTNEGTITTGDRITRQADEQKKSAVEACLKQFGR
jgi:hypothetical protein